MAFVKNYEDVYSDKAEAKKHVIKQQKCGGKEIVRDAIVAGSAFCSCYTSLGRIAKKVDLLGINGPFAVNHQIIVLVAVGAIAFMASRGNCNFVRNMSAKHTFKKTGEATPSKLLEVLTAGGQALTYLGLAYTPVAQILPLAGVLPYSVAPWIITGVALGLANFIKNKVETKKEQKEKKEGKTK